MRFKRYGRFEFRDTPRKRAAVLRRQQRERDALPLFADLVARDQIPVDLEMAQRRASWDAQEARDRQRRAAKWREGRARMRRYPAAVRAVLMAYWNNHRWLPGDPEYFLDMMHGYDHGRLNLDAHGVCRTA